jgi:hypothetical protein
MVSGEADASQRMGGLKMNQTKCRQARLLKTPDRNPLKNENHDQPTESRQA